MPYFLFASFGTRQHLPVPMSKKVILTHPAKRDTKQNIGTPSYDPYLFSNTYNDYLFPAAVDIILEAGQASTSILQRRLKLGYSRAARLIDEMERNGYVEPFHQGSTPRRILIKREQWEKVRSTLHHKPPAPTIDTAQIIRDEENWRRERLGLSPIEYELQKIDGMSGHAFEEWCADLLRRNGFSSIEVTPGSGDQGVDITAEKDGLKYAVQCKRYASDLGNTPIQEVVAGKAFYRCNVAAVMTNQHFTRARKSWRPSTEFCCGTGKPLLIC